MTDTIMMLGMYLVVPICITVIIIAVILDSKLK